MPPAAEDDEEFFEALKEAALGCHGELMRRGQKDPDYRGMATTLTLYLGVWPCAYLLQVGDSRCYILEQGQLTQITRDQTMAQELIDLGVMKPADAKRSKLGHTLSSAIGGRNTEPVVTRLEREMGQRRTALQRRAHPARLRRPHPRAAAHHEIVPPGLRGSAEGCTRRRRDRQHHPDRRAGRCRARAERKAAL